MVFAIQRRRRGLRTLVLAVVLAGSVASLAACAPTSTEGEGQSDHEPAGQRAGCRAFRWGVIVDPEQETRRTGPSVDIGGPPSGGQGLEDLGDGRWCEGIALFWGGEGVPEGVTFTVRGHHVEP